MASANYSDITGRVIGHWSGGGGGGSSPVLVARKVIVDADILTLPTLFYELVPAPPSGQIIWPLAAFLVTDIPTSEYTNLGPTAAITHDPANLGTTEILASLKESFRSSISNLLGAGAVGGGVGWMSLRSNPATSSGGVVNNTSSLGVETGLTSAAYDGLPLLLVVKSADDNPLGGGDPANTLTVTVLYSVVTL